MCLWAHHITFLSLNFFICKKGMISPIFKTYCQDEIKLCIYIMTYNVYIYIVIYNIIYYIMLSSLSGHSNPSKMTYS